MTRPWAGRATGASLLLLLLVLPFLVQGTLAAFSGATSVSTAVASDALAARLSVERPDAAVAVPAGPAATRYVEQLRPLGGGLVTGFAAATSATDAGASATVLETGSDRLRVPANGTLDAGTSGWTASSDSSPLDGQADHVATGEAHGGALRFRATGSTAGPVSVALTWSTTFSSTGGARSVSLRHDVRVLAAQGATGTNVLDAELVAPGGAVTVLGRSPVAAGPAADGAGPWRTTSVTAPASAVSAPGSYTLRLVARLQLAPGRSSTVVVLADDIALDVTGALLVPVPENRTFDRGTETWTPVEGELGRATWSPSEGDRQVGSMRVSLTGGALAATGTVNWSTTFAHDGGSAGAATLSFSHHILLGNEVTERTGYTVRLHKPSGTVVEVAPFRRLVPGPYPGLDPEWTRRSLPVPTSALDETGTYRLSVFTEIYSKATTVSTATPLVGLSVGYDDIVLERIATGRHVDVEAVVPAAFRSTARLEWLAATTGDPVAVALWRDGAWHPLAPVTSGTLTAGSTSLQHRRDTAQAEVRLRFTSAAEAVTDDVLRLDFVRVVPTDPPLLPADTDLSLPAVVTGLTAARLPGVLRLGNGGGTPLTLGVAADAPVLAWAGFDASSVTGGGTCTTGWTDGTGLTTQCTLPPGATVLVDVRVVGGRPPGAWSAALVLSDVDRPGFYRTVLPVTVRVTS